MRRVLCVLVTLLPACGALAPPPPCDDVRPCPDGGVADAPSDVLKYVDAPIITVRPEAEDAGAAL